MRKALTDVVIKDADLGLVEAVFARFDVIDRDSDVTRKGAFTDGQAVVISAYGHGSWEGKLPVGKGAIYEVGDVAVMRGEFFLNTTHGRDTFETVKALSADGLQEWSYSLHDVESERGVFEGKQVRFLNKIRLVKEVSPVLRGAGIDTGTLDIKSADRKQLASSIRHLLADAGSDRFGPDDGWCYVHDFDVDAGTAVFVVTTWDDMAGRYRHRMIQVGFTRTDTAVTLGDDEIEVHPTTVFLPKSARFAEHLGGALVAVKALSSMAVERLTHRAAEGKSTTEQVAAYEQLVAELAPLKAAIDGLATTPTPAPTLAAEIEAEFHRSLAAMHGVR